MYRFTASIGLHDSSPQVVESSDYLQLKYHRKKQGKYSDLGTVQLVLSSYVNQLKLIEDSTSYALTLRCKAPSSG